MFVAVWVAAVLGAVDAPVTAVVVYSDRARVTRTASVGLSGTQKVELPLLMDSVDTGSIRVEASGGQLQRVDIQRVPSNELPIGEAQKLISAIDALDVKLSEVREQLRANNAVLGSLQRLTASSPPPPEDRPEPRLTSTGWVAAIGFVGSKGAALQAKARELGIKQRALEEERRELAEKAQLLGAQRQRSGVRVVATVSGSGSAKLALTYVVGSSRWYPSYDLQLLPDTGKVLVSFSGLVSQESGEDWSDAQLTLSTAIPASSPRPPRLLSWKIGEKERFIPTPQARVEQVLPPPPAVPLPRTLREQDAVMQRLAARAQSQFKGMVNFGSNAAYDQDEGGIVGGVEGSVAAGALGGVNRPPAAPPPMPSRRRAAEKKEAPAREYESMAQSAPAAAPESDDYGVAAEEIVITSGRSSARREPTVGLPLAPPPAYVRPSYAANLPATLAAGYDLSFASLRRESVKTGGGARRVALFSETWPVSVERKLFPALAQEAFLVAEIKSPSKQVLPGGSANLFVGADPSGTAQLKLVAPGEPFTLPLGLDRALRPIRNVKLVTAEKGFIGKEELTEYEVTTEIANPYATAIPVRILDQWPLSGNDDTEVKLLRTEPGAIQDKATGGLEWRLSLPARGKTTVKFTYSIRRPKGWRMQQSQ